MKIRQLAALTAAAALVLAATATTFAGGGPGGDGGSDAKINVLKTADKTSLPFGGGSVTFTYTVTNPGSVDLSGVQVGDNTCDSPAYVSGDTGSDGILSPGEAWVYTCVQNVTETQTNTVTVAACASAPHYSTSVTEAPTVAPTAKPCSATTDGCPLITTPEGSHDLICVQDKDELVVTVSLLHLMVTKTPAAVHGNPSVTFTFTVKNDGLAPLDTVTLGDSLCSPVTWQSSDGAGNGTGTLAVGETWTYTCVKTVTADETDVATANACAAPAPSPSEDVSANHFKSADPSAAPECVSGTANATVHLSDVEALTFAPTLPPTTTSFFGSSGSGNSIIWIAAILAILGTVALVATPRVSRRRR